MSANNTLVPSAANGVPALVAGPTRDEILKALKLNQNSPETMALIFTCERYGLDPILKHALLIQGTLYVTRDGLMHVAHVSGKFDGLEVEQLAETPTHFIARATVWRKDMGRPFVFQGRFPKSKTMAKEFGPEMAEKVAECRALRRAFDISLCSREETWENDDIPLEREKPRQQEPQKALSAPVEPTQQSSANTSDAKARYKKSAAAFVAAAGSCGYEFLDTSDRIYWLNLSLGKPGDTQMAYTADDLDKATENLPKLLAKWIKEQKPEGYLPETESGIIEGEVTAAEPETDLSGLDYPFADTPDAAPQKGAPKERAPRVDTSEPKDGLV